MLCLSRLRGLLDEWKIYAHLPISLTILLKYKINCRKKVGNFVGSKFCKFLSDFQNFC